MSFSSSRKPSTFFSTLPTTLLWLVGASATVILGGFIGYGHAHKNIATQCNHIEAFHTPYGSFSCFPYVKSTQEFEEVIIEKDKK